MRASLSKLGLARVAVLVAAGLMASTAYAWDIMLKDWSVERPTYDRLFVVGSDGRLRTGPNVRDLEALMQTVSDQSKALDELRGRNDALSRKLEEQAQKIANLERKQGDGGRSSDSQKGEIDKLTRAVDNQKNELDKLSRSVSQLSNSGSTGDRKIDDLQRRVDDVRRSVDDLRSRLK